MIQFTRESAYSDALRAYQVEIDGVVVGEIANGTTKSFAVEPGKHTVRVKIAWTSSRKLTFKVDKDQGVHFTCRSAMVGPRAWLSILYMLFLPHKYIDLWLEEK